MTQHQIRMARHALGLDRSDLALKRSYRNLYRAVRDSEIEREWDDMVSKGMAVKDERNPLSPLVGFCLTDKGARAVLQAGESLDPEDFPDPGDDIEWP